MIYHIMVEDELQYEFCNELVIATTQDEKCVDACDKLTQKIAEFLESSVVEQLYVDRWNDFQDTLLNDDVLVSSFENTVELSILERDIFNACNKTSVMRLFGDEWLDVRFFADKRNDIITI